MSIQWNVPRTVRTLCVVAACVACDDRSQSVVSDGVGRSEQALSSGVVAVGEPCGRGDECVSGMCLNMEAGTFCVSPCTADEGCGPGWHCERKVTLAGVHDGYCVQGGRVPLPGEKEMEFEEAEEPSAVAELPQEAYRIPPRPEAPQKQ